MKANEIAKNLLENKTCDNCERDRLAIFCYDVNDNTCEEWVVDYYIEGLTKSNDPRQSS